MRYITEDCLYSQGVTCDKPAHCYKCGWNPTVAAERTAEIRERIENKGYMTIELGVGFDGRRRLIE